MQAKVKRMEEKERGMEKERIRKEIKMKKEELMRLGGRTNEWNANRKA